MGLKKAWRTQKYWAVGAENLTRGQKSATCRTGVISGEKGRDANL